MAVGLAKAGAHIAGVSRSDMNQTKKIVENYNVKFVEIYEDLSKLSAIQKVINHTLSKLKKINILVNNAGIIRRADITEFSEKDWDDVMNLNIKNLFFLSQAVSKIFIKNATGGKIINIASMLSFQGGIRVPSYTASKSAVLGITKLMANELAKYNIQVNAIAPGYMSTNNTQALRNDNVRNKEILTRIPMGRWGEPQDMQGAVIFLSSNASNYVTGHTLAVDGGWLSR
jgi:2-deoxy-D-gluconate 3-dehydrogenase